MILGQLRMGARQAKNAALHINITIYIKQTKEQMNHIMKQSCSAKRTRMIRGVLPVKVKRVQNHAARGFLDPPAVLLQIDPRKKGNTNGNASTLPLCV